ncbi:TPA: ribosome biogenesis/translation initiation ATPase RLI [Candidatus Micrarchaeota archaeon]|nr:ribosome biogenesis/translation initiation ATPase RLI [Candidatus Micrarchaeota archaeon]
MQRRVSYKPQEIEAIPKMFSGTVRELLGRIDRERVEEIAETVGIAHLLDREVNKLSGGELQLLAVAAAIMKGADLYFFDEPSSYLDVKQRLRVARIIRSLAEKGSVMVVEHDLAVLDYLSDGVFIIYGVPGAYGRVSGYKSVREGINQFLDGFLREENMRIRSEPVRFEVRPPGEWSGKVLFEYPSLKKTRGEFSLEVEGGAVREGEIIGIIGPNGIGKTTFVRMLAGEIEPDEGRVETELKISYKPQYISFPDVPVSQLFTGEDIDLPFFESEIKRQLEIDRVWENNAAELSGGERQRVAIALCLAREADIYLLDEPSAFLDVDQRLTASKLIKRVIANRKKLGFVVEHDIVMMDYVSDRLIVFSGEPGRRGRASAPLPMREGMNRFLRELGITFRRDPHTGRPRVNKPGSQKDVEQKKKGEYYYTGE